MPQAKQFQVEPILVNEVVSHEGCGQEFIGILLKRNEVHASSMRTKHRLNRPARFDFDADHVCIHAGPSNGLQKNVQRALVVLRVLVLC
jgi:hypothetical protein